MFKNQKGISLIKLILIVVLVIVIGAVSIALIMNNTSEKNNGSSNLNNNQNNDSLNNPIVDNNRNESTTNGNITINAVKNAKETDASKFEYEEVEGGISITAYNGNDEIVVIPSSIDDKLVVSIGESAFANCSTIIGLKLSDSVAIVEEKAFINCKGMRVLVTGDSLKIINTYGFANCTSLTDVELNDGLEELKRASFGFTNIDEIEIPSSVTVIESPFSKAMNEKLLVIGESGSAIEQYVKEKGEDYNLTFQAK